MINIKVENIDFDLNKMKNIEVKKAQNAMVKTANKTLQRVVDDKVVPMKTGAFQETMENQGVVRECDNSCYIGVRGPQAARLYYNPQFNFTKTKNENAKGYWFEDYGVGGKYYEEVCNDFINFYKE